MAWNAQVGEQSLGTGPAGVVLGLVIEDTTSTSLVSRVEGGWIRIAVDPSNAAYLGYDYREFRIADTAKTFTASRDTYVYVSSAGAVGYIEVTNGAAKPTAATLLSTGGYGAQFIAKVTSDSDEITGVTDLAARQTAAELLSDTVYLSFNATEVGAYYWQAPTKIRIWKYCGVVIDTLANTDVGTVTAAMGNNNLYTDQTNGAISFALSSATGVRETALPSAYHTIAAGQNIRLTSAKATAGGSCNVQIIYSRA